VQRCEAVWSDAQYASHRRAADAIYAAVHDAFGEIARRIRAEAECSEALVQRFLLDRFASAGLTTNHPPIVAVGAHSADPHYAPPEQGSAPIRQGDFVLIDLWAKEPDGVYADITWTGFVGGSVPQRYAEVFDIVRRARDAGVCRVRDGLAGGERLRGCDVDQATRQVIVEAGYGERFVHRTGHSIGTEVHGNGANIDGFETPDSRRLLPRTCFSIEPGIYLPGEFGVRSEIDVYLDVAGAEITGGEPQQEVVPILGRAA